jgi:hypothetical protein
LLDYERATILALLLVAPFYVGLYRASLPLSSLHIVRVLTGCCAHRDIHFACAVYQVDERRSGAGIGNISDRRQLLLGTAFDAAKALANPLWLWLPCPWRRGLLLGHTSNASTRASARCRFRKLQLFGFSS